MLRVVFGGSLAIGAIFSIGAIGAYVAFTLPVALRPFVVGNRFRAGPWNLGRWSWLSGYVASAFTLLMMPILCFPTVKGEDLDAESMNWGVVVWGGPMFLAMVCNWFKGPKINVEHKMLFRADAAASAA